MTGDTQVRADAGAPATMRELTRPRVALVDDHELVVQSLSSALGHAGVSCTAIAPRPVGRLLAALLDAAPRLVLLDLDLGPYGDAVPIIAALAEADIKVLVLTGSADRIRQAEALEQGAVGIVTKSARFDQLVATIRRVAHTDGVRRDPHAAELLAELAAHRSHLIASREPFDRLTSREKETLEALAAGWTVHGIAARWVVSETTVRSHVRSILSKLGVQSQLQAVVRAVHRGWISAEHPDGPQAEPLHDVGAGERAS